MMLPFMAACSSDPILPEPDAPAAPTIPDGPIELGFVISLGDDTPASPRSGYTSSRSSLSDPSDLSDASSFASPASPANSRAGSGSFRPSRAPSTPEGGYDPGSGYENFIDIDARDFALYIFTSGTTTDTEATPAGSDSRLVARAEITELTPISPDANGSAKRYTCKFRLENPAAIFDATGRASFRLVMLANWRAWAAPAPDGSAPILAADYPADLPVSTPGVPGSGATIDDLYAATASTRAYPDPVGPSITRDTRIPLFGVQAYTSVNLVANGLTDLPSTLHLLRAFAKIEVAAAPSHGYESEKIKSVTLRYCHTTFSAMPSRVYDRAHYVRDSHTLDYVDHVSIPHSVAGGFELPLQHTPTPHFTANPSLDTDGNGSWIIYVPEYDNTSSDATSNWLDVTFGDNKTYKVYFKNYGQLAGVEKDQPFDLRRNNWYIYTLRRRDLELDVEIDVQPYASASMEVGVGLLVDEMGDLMIYMEEDPATGELRLPSYFEEYLKLKGDRWTAFQALPAIHDEMGDYYAIHRGSDGSMENAEIWLKDRDGAQVLSDFDGKERWDTRHVKRYEGLSTFDYIKDRDGERQQQLHSDHSSIIYDTDYGLLYKLYTPDGSIKRFKIESWEGSWSWDKTKDEAVHVPGAFYVDIGEETDQDGKQYYLFRKFDKDGNQTRTVVRVDKETGTKTEVDRNPTKFVSRKSVENQP